MEGQLGQSELSVSWVSTVEGCPVPLYAISEIGPEVYQLYM